MATGGAEKEDMSGDCCVLKITGILPAMTVPDLELVFESERKSGGGEIKELELAASPGEALLTYKSLEVAERVLTRGSISALNTTLLVTRYEKPQSWDGRTVYVSGLRSTIGSEYLELIYESQKKSGGGPIQSITMEEDWSAALVTFEDAQDAENVLEREIVYLEKEDIVLYSQKPDFLNQRVETDQRRVCVSGIPPEMTEEVLELLFENKKLTGGGPILSMAIDIKLGTAEIQFESVEDADSVRRRQTVTWKGHELEVSSHGGVSSVKAGKGVETDQRRVLVSGIPSEMSEELLHLLFENKKASGGGTVDSVNIDREFGMAEIRFQSVEDAACVRRRKTVMWKDHEISVSTNAGESSPVTERKETRKSTSVEQQPFSCSSSRPDRKEARKSSSVEQQPFSCSSSKPDRKEARKSSSVEQQPFSCSTSKTERKEVRKSPSEGPQQYSYSPSQTERKEPAKSHSTVNTGSCDCLVVTGIEPSTSEELVRMFFENRNTCHGGDILELVCSIDVGLAVMRFQNDTVVADVLRYHSRKPLLLNESQLNVTSVPLTYFGNSLDNIRSRSIIVTDLPETTTEDGLIIWFENARTCGGGRLDSYYLNSREKRAVLTYRMAEDAENVLSKFRSDGLEYDSHNVFIRPLHPRSLPPLDLGHCEKDKLCLKNLPSTSTSHDIKKYFKAVKNCSVDEVTFGQAPGIGLITFARTPEFGDVYQLVCQKPLEENMLEISAVRQSRCVEVYGIGDLSEQKLLVYFEHSTSQGGAVEEIQILSKEECAIITFVDRKDAIRVVQKQSHSYDKRTMCTPHLHYECIGIIPAVPLAQPNPQPPLPNHSQTADIVMDNLNKTLVKFLWRNPQAKAEIEAALATVHTQIDWPVTSATARSTDVILKCTLRKQHRDFAEKAPTWERIARNTFELVLSQFRAESFAPGEVPWKEFIEKMKELPDINGEDCEIVYNNKEEKIMLIGRKVKVTEMLERIQQMDRKLAADKTVSQERLLTLKTHQLRLLLAHRFPIDMEKLHSHTTVKIDMKQCHMTISGPQAAIDKVKVRMYEVINSIESETITYSFIMCDLLSTDTMKGKLFGAFRDRGIRVHMDVLVKTGVRFYATNPANIQKGRQVIQDLTDEVSIRLEDGSEEVIRTYEWKSLNEHLSSQHPGLLMIGVLLDRNSIVIAATKEIIRPIQAAVEQFLKENTMLTSVIPMQMSYVQYIMRHRKDELMALQKSKTLQMKSARNRHEAGFSVRGNNNDLKQAKAFLNGIRNELMKKSFVPDQKTIGTFFEEERGQSLLKTLEEEHKVIIDTDSGNAAGMTRKATATLRNGRLIYVVAGDITKFNGDAIVNAANTTMKHGGGIAKAIVDRGGQSIQEECRKHVWKHGPVSTGQACMSEPGFLSCKKVIHTVGPVWKSGRHNEHALLRQAIDSSLDLCTKHGFRSIAFPAVSAGIYGFPLEDACNIIVGTIRDCLEGGSCPVTEVTLIDRTGVTDAFTQSLTLLLGEDRVSLMNAQTLQPAFPDHLTQVDTETPERPVQRSMSFPAAGGGASIWLGTSSRTTVKTSEGVRVHVTSGSLTRAQVDAMVNLTSRELNLRHGAVSQSILAGAGQAIQRECNQAYPNGIQYGGFAKTRGHSLPCQFVYHGSCERYGQPNAVTNMKNYIARCLQVADTDGLGSIAFPSLGTGSLGFSGVNISRVMYEEIRSFSENHPNSSLQDVTIVVYEDSVRKVFEDEMQSLLNPNRRELKKPTSHLRRITSAVSTGVKSLVGKSPPKEPPKKLVLCVIGSSKQEYHIDQVIGRLKDICKNEITVKKFNSKQDQENIEKLTREQLQRIKGFEATHHIAVEIDTSPGRSYISIEGKPQHITEVISEIYQIFREMDSEERNRYEMEIIGRLAQWRYKEKGVFVNYPKEINAIIEKAHADKKQTARWSEGRKSGGTKNMEIDFKKEVEYEVGNWQKQRRVARNTGKSETKVPSTWTKGKGKVEVDRNSSEYRDVQGHFYRSMTAHGTNYTKLVKIYRIQNEAMYKKYQIHKQYLDETNKKGAKNERRLWHGTGPTVLDEINTNGFNRSFNTRAWYGKGVYFATEAGLSAGSYTTVDANGHKYIYRALVLTGEYTKGDKTMNVPPPKNPTTPSVKFDSVVDNVQNPREWVVFTDSSAYPEYLFQFH